MRHRYLVILAVLLGFSAAGCAQSSSLSLDPTSVPTTSGDDGSRDSGPVLGDAASGETQQGQPPTEQSGDSSESEYEGWQEVTSGIPNSELSTAFGGLGDVEARVYTPDGSDPESASAVVIDITMGGEQAAMLALVEQMGGMGETIKINGKSVTKLSDAPPEEGGCMLMWRKNSATISVAQGDSCSTLIPLLEQII